MVKREGENFASSVYARAHYEKKSGFPDHGIINQALQDTYRHKNKNSVSWGEGTRPKQDLRLSASDHDQIVDPTDDNDCRNFKLDNASYQMQNSSFFNHSPISIAILRLKLSTHMNKDMIQKQF